MILKDFQKDAVENLLIRSKDLLSLGKAKKLILRSPTGSGKTVMLAEFLNRLAKTKNLVDELCFVWTAPRNLHKQSKEKRN